MVRKDASDTTPRVVHIMRRFARQVANAYEQGRSKDIVGQNGLVAQAALEFSRTEHHQETHQIRANRFPNLIRAFGRQGKPVPREIEELSS